MDEKTTESKKKKGKNLLLSEILILSLHDLMLAFSILYLWLNDERRDDAAHEYAGMLLCTVVPRESAFGFLLYRCGGTSGGRAGSELRRQSDFFEVELYEFVSSAEHHVSSSQYVVPCCCVCNIVSAKNV